MNSESFGSPSERHKVACVAGHENAVAFTDHQYLPRLTPEDARGDD
jgi:hypothetical protein